MRETDDYDENLAMLLATWPETEPLDEAARDAVLRALRWLLEDIGADGIVIKVMALRYLMRMERRSMEKVARSLHVSRAAISKQCTRLADSLGIPGLRSRTSREIYRRAALNAWEKRKAKLHGDNGQI